MTWYTTRYETDHGELEPDFEGSLVDYDEAAERIAELEAAIDKLAQGQDYFNIQANFKALIAVREKNLHK